MTDFDEYSTPQELPALSKIMTLATKAAADRGLHGERFSVQPNFDPAGPHHASIMYFVDDDWIPPGAEQEADPEFEKVIRDAEIAEREQKAEEARASLADLRDTLKDKNKGIGLDD